jgi:hypothetical protein
MAETRLNLPVDLAIARIRKDARGRALYIRVVFSARPAVSACDHERIDVSAYLKVSFAQVAKLLSGKIGRRESAWLVPIVVEDGYVWVG